MKKLFSFIFATAALTAVSQPKKAPKMAPVLTPGYYVVAKGDTVKGEVQTNPEDETDFYHKFGFKPAAKGGKVIIIDTKKAKAYGYDDKQFALINVGGEEVYAERLATGRLNFYEYRFNGKVNGNPGVEVDYFIQDTKSEDLKEVKKLSRTFFRKELKPYMKEQEMLWSDIDKFTFSKQKITEAIKEFNKFYAPAPAETE
ncbi:MAG: hypothetical protein IT236_05765 [Bacteroidia bacterium]|nr:hypothetical protein [Bacteroidia bacterium]